jgi:hypothetical protein
MLNMLNYHYLDYHTTDGDIIGERLCQEDLEVTSIESINLHSGPSGHLLGKFPKEDHPFNESMAGVNSSSGGGENSFF